MCVANLRFFFHFIACHHLHTAIYYIHLMEGGVSAVVVHVHRIGISAYLCFCLFNGSFYFCLRRLALQIFKFNDI